MYLWNERISFSVSGFPGCCGIACLETGGFNVFDDEGYDEDGDHIEDYTGECGTFAEFLKIVKEEDGEVGTILFCDNPGGPLDTMYDALVPAAPWVKKELLAFVNPKTKNNVVLKALVRT